ncbi:restriction endonuclease subunit S [Candidatus Dojkabacteria bacterium]|uniref:Restriction endonuclease subunit S n=1 Tax=Candidatus Dojkabacteria bacterium TaxID=2099670 RepID=A0A955RHE0_9BACT|nr:restriction endonuclease subunit S [Candidatus Dojkabacteria bacterium]
MIDKLGKYIIKESIRYDSIDRSEDLPVYGVSNVEGITETQHKRSADLSKYLVIRKGNFAYNPYRINVGSIGLTGQDKEGLVSPAYVVFRTDENKLLPELLFDFLKSDEGLKQINKYARGTVRKALRFEDLAQIEMPIPDMGTQNKILEKKKRFDKNIRKLLDSNRVQVSEIKELRQQILQDAISGKLSEQWTKENPNVESAEILLQKIKAEKEKLVTEGKIRKQKELPSIQEDEIPFELPNGWVWCRLGDICFKITDGFHNTPPKVSDGFPYIAATHIKSDKIYWSGCNYVAEKFHRELFLKATPQKGEILVVNIGAGCGTPAIIDVDFEFSFKNTAILKFDQSEIYNKYVYYYFVLKRNDFYNDLTKGGLQPFLSLKILNDIIFPLPPLSEQHHIVERIEYLFAKLDRIKELNIDNQNKIDLLNQVVLNEMFKDE